MADNSMPAQSNQTNMTEQPDPFDPAPHRDISTSSVVLFFLALGIVTFNFVFKRLKK
ncbi:MAG: hypothetical protein ABF760_07810 [Zymomonas mobilis]|uniref:hypothetical protein n=1 Tax=Zymomonas mobilis TaxID=542 RepID=UPI00163B4A91|nr:hypothetical protein [Zymomonas mobilis]